MCVVTSAVGVWSMYSTSQALAQKNIYSPEVRSNSWVIFSAETYV